MVDLDHGFITRRPGVSRTQTQFVSIYLGRVRRALSLPGDRRTVRLRSEWDVVWLCDLQGILPMSPCLAVASRSLSSLLAGIRSHVCRELFPLTLHILLLVPAYILTEVKACVHVDTHTAVLGMVSRACTL